MADDYFQLFLSTATQVKEETIQECENRINTWVNLREKWRNHYNDEIPLLLKEKRNELLMAVRFTECYQTISWIEFLALSVGYYIAIRELRSILEAIIQAYYIDMKYPKISIEGKLAILKEFLDVGRRESFGRALINRANPPNNHNIQALYGQLCEFVHPSLEQVTRILESPDSDRRIVELMAPIFDKQLFEQCCHYSEEVISHVIKINDNFVRAIQPLI
ncbi:hypothetical protein ACFLZG_00170 [Thermodesulfobacteriota bacterium]